MNLSPGSPDGLFATFVYINHISIGWDNVFYLPSPPWTNFLAIDKKNPLYHHLVLSYGCHCTNSFVARREFHVNETTQSGFIH